LPLPRFTNTYHALVSTVAADAALVLSATAVLAARTVVSRVISARAQRLRRTRSGA
jgi:hypothetical protein